MPEENTLGEKSKLRIYDFQTVNFPFTAVPDAYFKEQDSLRLTNDEFVLELPRISFPVIEFRGAAFEVDSSC